MLDDGDNVNGEKSASRSSAHDLLPDMRLAGAALKRL